MNQAITCTSTHTGVGFCIICAPKLLGRPQLLRSQLFPYACFMEPLPPVSWITRLLINLLRRRKDVLSLSLELSLPEESATPEDGFDYDYDLDELLAEEAADTIDTLNRIYNFPSARQH